MMRHRVKIQKKVWFSPSIFGIEFYLPGINPEPGQFFQIQVSNTLDPFLNRPISIADYNKNRILLIIKVVGRGTQILSRIGVGDELNIFGPFGKGVKITDKKGILIAGGIGVAPLYFLARKLKARGIDFTFIYGAKTPADLILKKELKMIAPRFDFITETGGRKRGTVLSLLEGISLSDFKVGYACGPKQMLKELKDMDLKIPIYAFCEDFLGCGCGLCLGCAIRYNGEYKRICEDGPVFELRGIEF
jgi:dihydroorotate dehydrogenase electron transfer subunit|uniref:FAD-binding FR-type domain-containing protein n=1 Tax=candidate division WOR-3 bacterium TaxID=2052148 RepID=A0A7V3RHQ3_UNCW3